MKKFLLSLPFGGFKFFRSPTTHGAFTSFARATSKAALCLFSAALLLAGGTGAVRGQSALDGFDPNANGTVQVVVFQPDGKILIGGSFTTVLGVPRNRIARLNPDGTLDIAFNPNANNTVFAIAVQADGKILAGGQFFGANSIGGATRNRIARLDAVTGAADLFDPNANNIVYAIAVQADGKILAGGTFNGANSIGGATRNRIARLDAVTGAADLFDSNANNAVYAIAVQSDSKILAGGDFNGANSIGGATRNRIARLDAVTGAADSFNPNAISTVYSIAVQADGKVLAGGAFTGANSIGGATRNRIARLDAVTGAADSFDPNATNIVHSIAVQADGKILAGGAFTGANSIGGATRNRIARLDAVTGAADSFDPNANSTVFAIAVQADGKILAGGQFNGPGSIGGQTRNNIARLETDGRLDQTLNLSTIGSNVLATAVQPDGKILIGGNFSNVLGVARNNIARLNTDGTLDTNFNPNANNDVRSIVVQPDGKILAAGFFTNIGGQTRNRIARLDATTGAADLMFDPNANDFVQSIALQADDKILVGGNFNGANSIGGQTRNRIARLDATTGAADLTFNPNANDRIDAIAVQADGRILAGGLFTSIGGQARNRVARLDATTGAADLTFNPNANGTVVASIAVQPDGKILAGGDFSTIGGQTRNRIARLSTTGLLDSFNPNANSFVNSIAVQADGKILVCGGFTTIGGQTRNRIARLDATIGLADSLNPNANSFVQALAVQPDGKILAGGSFTSIGGQPRSLFARLTNDTAALQNLAVTQSTITWTRGGSSPQFTRVTFEYSNDSVTYVPLGIGTASGSNWTLTGLSLPTGQNIYIRARGYYRSGYQNGSESITESVRNAALSGPPAITSANNAAFTVGSNGSFAVTITGIPTPTLSESGALPSGVTFNTATGVLSGTPATGTGGVYPITFTASNGVPPDAMQNFTLTVNQAPAITSANNTTFTVGSNGSFTVTRTGFPTPPLSQSGTLPSGVTFNPATGVLSGTPAAGTGGVYPITFTASNGVGSNFVQNFTLTVNQAPAITSANNTTFTVGSNGSFTVTRSGFPTPTLSRSGALPSGVTFNTATGVLGGTPVAGSGGTYPITFTASNGVGSNAVQNFTLTVNQAPALTGTNNVTFIVGSNGSIIVLSSGFPAPVVSESGALPSGVTFNTATRVLGGTPAAGTGGTYPITFNASNGVPPDAMQNFTLTVNQAPAITSANNATFTVGSNGSFTVTRSGFPTPTLSESGALPSGVTFNTATGVLSGTPAPGTGGIYPIAFTASNGVGSPAMQSFTLTINTAIQAPIITSPLSATRIQGQQFTYQFLATGATSLSVSNLPPGLMFDPILAAIVGTPTQTGTFDVLLSASNAGGTTNETLVLEVQAPPPSGPIIISSTSVTGRTGRRFTFQVITMNATSAARVSATGLPSDLTINPVTGLISGTPTSDDSFPVMLLVTDGSATATGTLQLTFTSDPAIPVITSLNTVPLTPGQFVSYMIEAPSNAGPSDPTIFSFIGMLPAGLNFDAAAGTISGFYVGPPLASGKGGAGKPDLTGGVLGSIQLFATNSHGTSTFQLLFLARPSGAVNISTRLLVGTDDNVLIGGFIIQGNAPKVVIIRAIGPSTGVPGSLQDPILELHDSTGRVVVNDNWKETQEAIIRDSGLPPLDDRESAMVIALDSSPGGVGHTAIVRGANGTTGVALVEVYDLGSASFDSAAATRLANISTRGRVDTGDNVMIGGFIVSGQPTRVIVRATGPSLNVNGVPVPGRLQDTTLELRDASGALVASNDDWRGDQEQEIFDTGLAPTDNRESAIVATLNPGPDGEPVGYTAIVRGKNGSTGVALVEVFVFN